MVENSREPIRRTIKRSHHPLLHDNRLELSSLYVFLPSFGSDIYYERD